MNFAIADRAARRDSAAVSLLDKVLTFRGVLLVWLCYAAANALIRFAFSRTLSNDDAISSTIAQAFQLGYQKIQPPLWEWLLVSVQQVLGTGIESALLLRYGAIALIGIGTYCASLRVSGDRRWSAAVSLGYPLAYQLGWPFFEWGTQALLLTAACLFTIDAGFRYVEKPDMRSAAYLGLAAGLGLLTKFIFALFLLAFLAALILRPAGRHALKRPTSLLAAAIALLVIAPYACWFVDHFSDVNGAVGARLRGVDEPYWQRTLTGLRRLVNSLPGFIAPGVLIVLGLWWAARREGRPAQPASFGERTLRDTVLIALALLVIGIVLVGATHVSVGHLHFALVPLLPYTAAVLARGVAPEGRRVLAGIAVFTLLLLTAARVFSLANGGWPAKVQRAELWPYEGLAHALQARGLGGGTLVAFDTRDAGNLKAFLPGARVVLTASSPFFITLDPPQNPTCAAVWLDADALSDAPVTDGGNDLGEKAPALVGKPRENIDVLWPPTLLGSRKTARFALVLLAPDDPLCR